MPDPAPDRFATQTVTVDEFPTEIRRARLADLRPLQRNARFMRADRYQRLVDNIRRDRKLTSVPLACLDPDGGYTILSGNHRVRAAIDALGSDTEADVMFIDQELTAEQRLGLQLSHNAVEGEDDPAILKELYEEIDDLEFREYAGLDDKTLDLLEKVQVGSLSEAHLEFDTVTLTFLPDETGDVRRVFDLARQAAAGEMWLASMADYDRTLQAITAAGDSHDVSNLAVALRLALAVVETHLTDLQAGWWDDTEQQTRHKAWVPISTVLGGDRLPPDAAAVLKRAVDKLQSLGDINHPWQAVEYLAADWLAGNHE